MSKTRAKKKATAGKAKPAAKQKATAGKAKPAAKQKAAASKAKPVAKKKVAASKAKPVAKKKAAAKKKAVAKKKAAAKKTPATKAKPAAKKKAAAKKNTAAPITARPPSPSHERLRAVADRAIATLRRLGVDAAEVSVATGHELEISVRQGAVELVKEAGSSGLSVRVIQDGRVATSSTTDLGGDAIDAFLARAVEMAEVSEPDALAVPPPPRELARDWPALDLFDDETSSIDAGRAIVLAQAAEAAALAADARITASEGASFGRSSGHSVFATTGGFVGERSGTYQSLAVQAVADDAGGKKRNGVYWTGGRFFAELESPAAVGREAAARALRQLGAIKMDTGVFPVVFDKDAARSILGLLAGCILGDSVYRERSYLARKLGESVASKHVTVVDDPLVPRGPGSRAFDGEGRAVRKILVVDRGKLATFLLDTYSARKLGRKPTGSAAGGGGIPHASTSNFVLQNGKSTPAQLLEGIERGLYVHRMMGFGFDATTGNFSRGAEGFLIENGALTVPVGEITISRNLDELLKGIDRVANDLDHRTATSSPSFRVDAMTIAGA